MLRLSLRWAHSHFVGFVMSWLNFVVGAEATQAKELPLLYDHFHMLGFAGTGTVTLRMLFAA